MISDAMRIEHRIHDEVHDCIVPGCGVRARVAFIAAEDGRIAGRDVRRGDVIDLCAPHGDDVYRAQGQRYDELPEWLKADAKTDPLDGVFDLLQGL
ncbi:hypothetical protein [Sphaerisporangium aureirubrum]|uniref:Uncharacterized protein n=1 Tax=Sphaerisporangium aureirubrum TaxID=1544736 RepID=A0ABW1NFX9_9ACTN